MDLNPLIKSYLTGDDCKLYLASERAKTFKNWPLGNSCKCTPNKLAEAGFHHTPTEDEPDAARCYFCLKELDGWEPDDDPWKEHESHSPKCPFLKLGKKPVSSWTMEELSSLHSKRLQNKIGKVMDIQIACYRDKMNTVRSQIQKCAKK